MKVFVVEWQAFGDKEHPTTDSWSL